MCFYSNFTTYTNLPIISDIATSYVWDIMFQWGKINIYIPEYKNCNAQYKLHESKIYHYNSSHCIYKYQ